MTLGRGSRDSDIGADRDRVWLSVADVGNLLRLSADEQQNDIANLATYAAVLLPIAFVIVFFAMERL